MKGINIYLLLFVFSLLLFGLHFFLNSTSFFEFILTKELIKIHVFISFFSLMVVFLSGLVIKKFPDKVGFTYLGLVLFKIIASSFLMFSFLSSDKTHGKIIVLNFLVIFFLHIVFEVWFLLGKLKKID